VTIHIAVLAVKRNIPCNNEDCEHHWYYENLNDENDFQRIRLCSQNNL